MSIVNACKYSLLLTLGLGACSSSDPSPANQPGSGFEGKGDGVALPLTPFVDESLNGSISFERYLVKTAAEYRDHLGSEPPAHIDFSRQWVLFYNAGVLFGGPFTVEAAAELDGDVLRITTRLTQPDSDCPPAPVDPDDENGGFAAYYVLATIEIPAPAPQDVAFVSDDVLVACGDGSDEHGATDCETRQGGAFVVIRVADHDTSNEEVKAWVSEESFIQEAERQVAEGDDASVPYFQLVNGRDCDAWTFHVNPETARWNGPGAEIYDALPSYVEANKGAWLVPGWQWSPWGSQVVEVRRQR